MSKSTITPEFARQALRDLIRTHEVKPEVEAIQKIVSDFFHIRLAETQIEKTHATRSVLPPGRNVFMPQADRRLLPGYRRRLRPDHSIVIHVYNLIARRIGNDSAFRFSIERVERELKATHASVA
jgi:chromosomal replication initiation ATPase DnaA